MSNSPLVVFTKLSPHRAPRTAAIDTITIHHMAGNASIEVCAQAFQGTRKASSNYGIGADGRVGLYVPESDRAATSSSTKNDNRAITIEVANDGGDPDWHVSDKALAKLIDLCVDICQRNGIERLNFTGDKTGNLTMHKWFAPTACPGPYLASKFPYIAAEVNKRLGVAPNGTTEADGEQVATLAIGDIVTLAPGATYATGKSIASFVFKMKLYVRKIEGDNITVSIFRNGAITGVVPRKYLLRDGQPAANTPAAAVPYLVRVTVSDLNIRKGPGVSYATKGHIQPGVYTIVEEQNGFGKLKSGAGWIALEYANKI